MTGSFCAAAYTATPSVPIGPSKRQGVVRTATRTADPVTFDSLRRLLRNANNQEDNYLYGGAMILVRDPKLVERILELGLTEERRFGKPLKTPPPRSDCRQ